MTDSILLSSVLDGDSYKFSHYKQYPPNTTAMFSYLESRGGKYKNTVFFGLQYYLKRFLSNVITVRDVYEAQEFSTLHGVPFNFDGWMRIATVLRGKLPVRIKAVPEGMVIPTGNILMSVESTDPETFWVVSWLETVLVRLWYPITVATQSYHIKQMLKDYLDSTSDDTEAEIAFKLHDFGSRGVSSQESAMIGGAAHLVNFMGSDTIAGIYMANKYYDHEMAGFSIPASEHSTMTMWGKENEARAYENMLEQYGDSPIFACVSDSYDIYNAAANIWGDELKDKVIKYKGTLVIRPDSGDPVTVVCNLLRTLENAFGTTANSKGYKVLNHGVRVIQGDGVNFDSIKEILLNVKMNGFSTTNVGFGMGGALLQGVNRDTQKFAFKCSWAEVNGEGVDVYKDPITDSGKRSKKGKLDLSLSSEGNFVSTCHPDDTEFSLLRPVYENGEILSTTTFDAVRARSNKEPAKDLSSKDAPTLRLNLVKGYSSNG